MPHSDIFSDDSQDTVMSEKEEVETETEENEQDYFDILISRITEKYPDLNSKCIYKMLVKKAKFYYNECAEMKEDKLWETISEKADSYKELNEDINPSDEAAFEYAMKKHKAVIIEKIKNNIEYESEEDSEDDNEEEEEDNVMNVNQPINNKSTGAYARDQLRRYGLL